MGQTKPTKWTAEVGADQSVTWLGPWRGLDQMVHRHDRPPRSALKGRAVGDRTNRRKWLGAGIGVAMTVTIMLTMFATSTPAASGRALPNCPVIAKWPVKPVAADVVVVLKRYFAAKHLTPITIYKNQETVLNVKEQSVGVHWCKNPDGSKSGYVGAVPKSATAAVMVHVKHKPYPVTQAASTFVTLAKMPRTGWRVVSEGTGP